MQAALKQTRIQHQREHRNPAVVRTDIAINVVLFIIAFLVFIPVMLMIFMSFRNTGQILTNFWSLPDPWITINYSKAWKGISPYFWNSILYCSVGVALIVILSSLTGYAMAVIEFPGKNILYVMVIALLMIPSVLSLFPLINVIYKLELVNTMWALVLPWASGGQVMGVMLMRTAFEGIHPEIREAAYVDGATDLQIFGRVCLPLAWPMAMTLAILNFVSLYNDFLWPLIIIQQASKQVVSVGLRNFAPTYGSQDMGSQMAAFVIASVPLLILFLFGMRYYITGISSGAVKM
ncbi:MAG: carbohydrate ABC transporter permease [Chloroflexi bacterium]|nr:carbohydrate ABC transporter permease [Chloroflexota bacterium]